MRAHRTFWEGFLGWAAKDKGRFKRPVEPSILECSSNARLKENSRRLSPHQPAGSEHRDLSLTPIRARHVSHVDNDASLRQRS